MLATGLVAAAGAAQADGYPPFYGYSPYLGGPAPYFTPDDTIYQATTESGGDHRNGGPGSFPDTFAARAEAAGTPVLRIAPEASDGDGAGPAEEIARFIATLRR